MLKLINDFLNKTTMYKVMTYGLTLVSVQGIVLAFFGILSFDPIWMALTFIVFSTACYVVNKTIALLLKVPTNIESAAITGLILFLIIQPASGPLDLLAVFLISIFAMASKYLLVVNKMHVFNPSATAAILSGLILNYYATWWVGSAAMLPLVLIVGILVIKKVRRFQLASIFTVTSIVSAFIFNIQENLDLFGFLNQIITAWPIIFFATIMLTEPLTMPGTRKLQMLYAFVIGILFSSRFNIGSVYSTPELALVIGNLSFFILKPREKFMLTFKEKIKLSPDIYEFIFSADKKLSFRPGQYLEWTLPHNNADSRGNRRFFTVASAPSEDDIKLGVKMNKPGSSFKGSLQLLEPKALLSAAHVSGDFVLDQNKPAVFIAGGIGVTPFRSIIKSLFDTGSKQKINLFYFAKKAEDFVYKDIFDSAKEKIGLKVEYIVSETEMDLRKMIEDKVDNYSHAKYYLSGPNAMVDSYKRVIKEMGVSGDQIVTDYFPGF